MTRLDGSDALDSAAFHVAPLGGATIGTASGSLRRGIDFDIGG